VGCGEQCLVDGGCHVVGGRWQVAGGAVTEIVMSVDEIVSILSLARSPRRSLTMPHRHVLNNCSLRFCTNGQQLGLGESRSQIKIFKRNLVHAPHQLLAYVSPFCLGLMVVTAMVMATMMIAMVMVLVMVIIVLEELREVGWLQQC
jgi:hypothetical protein